MLEIFARKSTTIMEGATCIFDEKISKREICQSRFFSIYDVFEVKSVNFLNFYKGKYYFSYTQQM